MVDDEKGSDGADPEEGHLDEESLRIVKESMERHRELFKRLAKL